MTTYNLITGATNPPASILTAMDPTSPAAGIPNT
jgi:hypothetical protein